jgi:hypothetical protein
MRNGHPTIEELVAAQGVVFPRDPEDLLGEPWPDDQPTDDFLRQLREWRGHRNTDPAA